MAKCTKYSQQFKEDAVQYRLDHPELPLRKAAELSLIHICNNLHEVDTWMFFKWVFKTFVAVMILTNTFNIVLAVFDVSQHVIQQSAGIIQNGTEITPDVLDSLRTELEAMELGPLFGLWLQSFLIQLTMIALNIVIFVIVYGRMIEIYLLTSLAPIPFATVPNRETGHMGQNDVYKRQHYK